MFSVLTCGMNRLLHCLLAYFVAVLPVLAEFENWTRESDQATISAELVDYDPESGEVTLLLENRKEFTMPAGSLVAKNRERLDSYAEKKKEAAMPRLQSFEIEGTPHKVHVYKPAGYMDGAASSGSRPIAFLYSAGGNSMSIVNNLRKSSDELGWLLVGVDAYRNTNSLEEKYEERMEMTKAAYKWVSENLTYDEEKIVFGGMSGGGWWSFQSAAELTGNAAGVLSFGGWMGRMYDKKYSRNMAVAIVNGDNDKNANTWAEKDADFLKKKFRATVKTFSFPGGHVMASEDVALQAARWIHETKEF